MFIPIVPVGKPRMTQRDRWAQRPAVVKYHFFCDALREKYKGELPERLSLVFHMPMPASWSRKKRDAMYEQPHQQRPDIDNLCKAVMDALSLEDCNVYVLHAEKYWSRLPGINVDEV